MDQVVTPLRRRPGRGYSDTAALNDIHAVLTRAIDPGAEALADIGQILARTGRPMIPARDIEVSVTESALGWPVACADAGDTVVWVRQDPASAGLLIEICTKTAAEAGALTVALDGDTLHPANPAI
jgi:hypothetical protein